MRRYHIGGLKVSSEIDLEIEECDFDIGDVVIKKGDISFYDGLEDESFAFEFSKKDFYMKLEDIAQYSVHKGETIIVDKRTDDDSSYYKMFIKGSAWGALLHQRNILPFHASSVLYKNKGVMICGVSGGGKSTLSYNMVKNGASYLCDDITAVRDFEIQPSHVSIKLWEDALKSLNEDYTDLMQIRSDINKYFFVPKNKCDETVGIDNIYILVPDKEIDSIEISTPSALAKINILRSQIYRYGFVDKDFEILKRYNDIIFKIAQRAKIRVVRRPEKCDINELTEAVINDIENN